MNKQRIFISLTYPSNFNNKFLEFKNFVSSWMIETELIEDKVLVLPPSDGGDSFFNAVLIYIPKDEESLRIFVKETKLTFLAGIGNYFSEWVLDKNFKFTISHGELKTEEIVPEQDPGRKPG